MITISEGDFGKISASQGRTVRSMGTKGLEATFPSAGCSGLPSRNIKLTVLMDIQVATDQPRGLVVRASGY